MQKKFGCKLVPSRARTSLQSSNIPWYLVCWERSSTQLGNNFYIVFLSISFLVRNELEPRLTKTGVLTKLKESKTKAKTVINTVINTGLIANNLLKWTYNLRIFLFFFFYWGRNRLSKRNWKTLEHLLMRPNSNLE